MHVVIIGAGEVGYFLAQRLTAERHDVVVVENDLGRAGEIAEQLDVQVVTGSGSSPVSLADAGLVNADLLAAVTQNDEVNLIASAIARGMGVPTRVVRLQNPDLRGPSGDELRAELGADLVMDPDFDTAEEILELLSSTGADEVYAVGGDDLIILGAFVAPDAPLANQRLVDIARSFEPDWNFLFGAITRDGETVIPRGNQEIRVGDHVRVLTRRSYQEDISALLGLDTGGVRRVMVLGGGAIGSAVARSLGNDGVDVVLVERDPMQAERLSRELRHVTVLRGDITDTELLAEEAVGRSDAVVAATGEDASNVLACAFARAEGAPFTIAVLHRLALLPLVRQFGINAAVSPRTASANAVLRHVRGGLSVATFLESNAEVDELEVRPGSKADGAVVADLHIPHDILLGAVVRADGSSEIVRGATRLSAGEHVVIFARPDAVAKARETFGG